MVAVKPVGAEAVTAVKLAVDGIDIEAAFLTNCFLKYISESLAAAISLPFNIKEPVMFTEPVNWKKLSYELSMMKLYNYLQ